MRISNIFALSGSYGNGDCGGGCDNDFRGKDDPNYFTGLDESRETDYRQYDDSTDGLLRIL